jgi:tRNA 2-thiouridine synthesizing protein E
LRHHFRAVGNTASARELLHELEHKVFGHVDRRRLFELFPRGPIAQASRIAGLPMPRGTLDPSFGSSH